MHSDKEKIFILSTFIKRHSVSQRILSQMMDYTAAHVSKVLGGYSIVTPAFLKALQLALGDYIDTLQAEYMDIQKKLSKEETDELPT